MADKKFDKKFNVPKSTNQPVSLRDAAPAATPVVVPEGGSSNQAMLVVLVAIIFLLAGALIATLLSGDGDGIDKAELREAVNEAVGTQVAALIPTNTPIPPTPTRIPNPIAADDDDFQGAADAVVTIVEFSDFQCGYCGRFYDETLPLILENYPNEVKFVYRDFPIFGEDSARAAMAAECAADQGKFWEMHNRIFDIHKAAEPVTLSQDTLVGFAEELGLETDSFSECLSSQKYQEEVLNDYNAAVEWGFRGTPGFTINGRTLTGAQPYEVFDSLIQAEIAAADGTS